MEQAEIMEKTANNLAEAAKAPEIVPSPASTTLAPQVGNGSCPTCGGAANNNSNGNGAAAYPHVYAIGKIEPRFPTMGVEKEYAQATGRSSTTGLTDGQALYEVLKNYRYLARQLCWVFNIAGVETYILQPRDPADFDLLVEALKPTPNPMNNYDVVIGVRGPIAPAEVCNGLMVPIVAFDQIYSFDRDTFIKAIPRPETIPDKSEEKFRTAAGELFDRIMQIADNAGATDEHRALNYLAVRYPTIYAKVTEQHLRNYSLTSVDVSPSALSGVRKIVEVNFAYTHRETDFTEQFFVRMDVTEEFPFLINKLSPYYNR